jgi:hypothetical protein
MSISSSLRWVRGLAFFDDMLTRFMSGYKIDEIIDWMDIFPDENFPDCRKLGIEQTRKHLAVWRRFAEEATSLYPPTVLKDMMRNVYENDTFAAHKLLANLQFDRVIADVEDERKVGTTGKKASASIKLMNQILVDVNKLEIEKNTTKTKTKVTLTSPDGIPNIPGTGTIQIDQQVREQYRERWGEATQKLATDPDARRRLLHLLEKARAQVTPGVKSAIEDGEKFRETIDAKNQGSSS